MWWDTPETTKKRGSDLESPKTLLNQDSKQKKLQCGHTKARTYASRLVPLLAREEPQNKKTRGAYAHRVAVNTPVETHILRD